MARIELTGRQKAAVLLISYGSELSSKILNTYVRMK